MTENTKYYNAVREKYPDTVTKEQFCKITHISKATARFLLQSGLVPCKDTGKSTHRYIIRTDDVIAYMLERKLHPDVYCAPPSAYHRSLPVSACINYRAELHALSETDREAFRQSIEQALASHPDLLSAAQVSQVTGYCHATIHRWCSAKRLQAFNISNKYLIPKISLAAFLVSHHAFDIAKKSPQHIALIREFLALESEEEL